MAEELWELLGHPGGIVAAGWPEYDEAVAKAEQIVVPVQVNGKVRARLTVPADTPRRTLHALALADPQVHRASRGQDGQEGDGGARAARQHRGVMKYWRQAAACVARGLSSCCSALLLQAGCGYSLAGRGSFLPAYIKTIGVPQFTNQTSIPTSTAA